MKYYVISHSAALAMLAHQPNPRHGDTAIEHVSLLEADVPSEAEARDIIEHFDLNIDKLDVLVAQKEKRRHSSHLATHLVSGELPEGSFISLASWGPDIALYVCCPELAYLQVSCGPAHETIYAGYAMTADYRLDTLAVGGVVNRTDSSLDSRLTTRNQISAYIDQTIGIRGRSKAQSLLVHVAEGSRSPRESALGMMFSLPARYGGFAIGRVELNKSYRIRDGKNRRGGRRTIVRTPDVILSAIPEWGPQATVQDANGAPVELHAAIDYDSDAAHTDTTKMERDVERRNELVMLDDVAHFTVTTEIMDDYEEFSALADRVRRKLKVRKRPLFNGRYSAEQRFFKEREVENKRFKLWQSLVEQKRSW